MSLSTEGCGDEKMSSFFNLFNIKARIIRFRKQKVQLDLYYPKNVYDPLARKEMKVILTRFNDMYYQAYPEMVSNPSAVMVDYHPRSHSHQYEIQRAIKLYKSQKVSRKDLVKIEEYLNLKYIIEEQLGYYNDKLRKSKETKRLLINEEFSSFFPQLFEERVSSLEHREAYSLTRLRQLEKEKQMCEKAIRDLLYSNYSFWGDAKKRISNMVSDSVKHVTDRVGQSFRGKSRKD